MEPFDKIRAQRQRRQLPEVDVTQGRTIAYSRSTTSRLMDVLDANVRGNVHGGVIMRMVDEAAAIVAIKHAGKGVVTARVDRFDFLAPAYLGNVVNIQCEMHYVGRSSMEVGVEVMAEDLYSGKIRQIARSQVTFVALDEHGKPTPVPPLIPGDEEERKIIEKARNRRAQMQKIDEELSKFCRGAIDGIHRPTIVGMPFMASSYSMKGTNFMADEFEYISHARIVYHEGYRYAYLGDVVQPVVYGVQGKLREYYGAKEGPPVASTLDQIVAAVAG